VSLLLALSIFARVSFAAPPETVAAADPKAAQARVQSALVEPLAAKERDQSRFSRARLPAQERRVRILDEKPRTDAQGGVFFTFAVDARHGVRADDAGWKLAAVGGCVYQSGEVFVQSGERHRPAAFLLGKNLKPVAEHVCKPATLAAATN